MNWRRLKKLWMTVLTAAAAGLAACAGPRAAQDPLTADEHMRLGSTYEEQGLRSAAVKEYAAALRRRRDYVPALMALGNNAFQKGDLIEAEIYYRRVLKTQRRHSGANNNLAMLYLVRGSRLETAEELATAALEEAGPFRPYVLDTLANVLMKRGRYLEAKAALDAADREVGPENALLREHLERSRRQLLAQTRVTDSGG